MKNQTQKDLAWLMSSERTMKDLESQSPEVARLAIHDVGTFLIELPNYIADFDRLASPDLSPCDHKRAKRLMELIDTSPSITQWELETPLGCIHFLSLAIAMIQSHINSYKHKNERLYKGVERLLSGGQAQTDIKLLFLQALLEDLKKQDTNTLFECLTTEERQTSVVLEGTMARIYADIYHHKPASLDELNRWLDEVILPGAATKKALSWFPETYLQRCALNIPALQVFAVVNSERESAAMGIKRVLTALAEEEAAVAPPANNRVSMRMNLARCAREDELCEKAVAQRSVFGSGLFGSRHHSQATAVAASLSIDDEIKKDDLKIGS